MITPAWSLRRLHALDDAQNDLIVTVRPAANGIIHE